MGQTASQLLCQSNRHSIDLKDQDDIDGYDIEAQQYPTQQHPHHITTPTTSGSIINKSTISNTTTLSNDNNDDFKLQHQCDCSSHLKRHTQDEIEASFEDLISQNHIGTDVFGTESKPIIYIWPTGPLLCNTILIADPNTRDAIIIDPGGSRTQETKGICINTTTTTTSSGSSGITTSSGSDTSTLTTSDDTRILMTNGGSGSDTAVTTTGGGDNGSNGANTPTTTSTTTSSSTGGRRRRIPIGIEIIPKIQEMNLNITKIIITHAHFDHFLGLGDFREAFPNAKVYLHQKEKISWHFLSLQLSMFRIKISKEEIEKIGKPDNFFINLDGKSEPLDFLDGEIIHTPGHSEGSICIYFKKSDLLISGDTLFRDAVGRSDLNGGSLPDLKRSILTKLYTLPNHTNVIPGHGPKTMIGHEKANNPMVKFGDPIPI